MTAVSHGMKAMARAGVQVRVMAINIANYRLESPMGGSFIESLEAVVKVTIFREQPRWPGSVAPSECGKTIRNQPMLETVRGSETCNAYPRKRYFSATAIPSRSKTRTSTPIRPIPHIIPPPSIM